MPSTPPTAEMGRRHEEHLAEVFGGTRSPGSGNQWTRPADGRSGHDEFFCFAWEGKSTHGKTLAFSRDVIAKIREQALGERPAIGLRFYGSGDLKTVDEEWTAVPDADMAELVSCARKWASLEMLLGELSPGDGAPEEAEPEAIARRLASCQDERQALAGALAKAATELAAANKVIGSRDREVAELRAGRAGDGRAGAVDPGPLPALPWAAVYPIPPEKRKSARSVALVVSYDARGARSARFASEVRVERHVNGRPRIYVDNVRLRRGDLYGADGALQVRAYDEEPSAERERKLCRSSATCRRWPPAAAW